MIVEQNLLRRIVDDSILPTLEVDVSDNDIDRAANEIADWMTEKGH